MPGLSLFVPAYNAEKTLPGVLERIPASFWDEILNVWIINDGSTDDTGTIIRALIEKYPKISATGFDENRGYGEAVKHGLAKVAEDGCDFAVCLHADGQYAPELLPDFFKTVLDNGYDILQGSRILPGTARQGGMPWYKYIAGRILTNMENMVFGLRMTDYHSGYLCYSRKALKEILFKKLSGSFDFDLEVIACARRRGLKIGEIGIPARYADEKSYLNPVSYGLRVLRVMGKYLLGKY